MKIAICDTYYSDFIKSVPLAGGTYEEELTRILNMRFGTHSAYSTALRDLGHECIDIIANHSQLQNLWAQEHSRTQFPNDGLSLAQIGDFRPDVVFLQDLSLYDVGTLQALRDNCVLAAQCSCRFDDDETLRQFDILLTSFPFYVERFKKLGIETVFLPLAFDPIVLEQSCIPSARTHAVSFVGGYGRHWEMDALFLKLAAETPIEFWGYGFEQAPPAIQRKWNGPAWGLKMYSILLSSHIVINRHGGIAAGYSNNLRMFEATGCGALMMTEYSPNIGDYFTASECAVYHSPQDAADKINYFLTRPDEIRRIASNGQRRTLSQHTYSQRMPLVSLALQEALCKRAA